MARKKTEISDAVTLNELTRQAQVVDPPIEVMLDRYGYAEEIGVDEYGMAAVPVETASEFLGAYEEAKVSRSRKWDAYQEFLQDRRVAISRAALDARREAEIHRQAAKVVDDEAPTFEEWEAEHGDD